jgi:hypothetical protein
MYKLHSKNDPDNVYTTFDTLLEAKWWFQNLCNIPSNWYITGPDIKGHLDGSLYKDWIK